MAGTVKALLATRSAGVRETRRIVACEAHDAVAAYREKELELRDAAVREAREFQREITDRLANVAATQERSAVIQAGVAASLERGERAAELWRSEARAQFQRLQDAGRRP